VTARIGVDTGGTFTDIVRWSRDGLRVHKLPSTPADPSRAVLEGIAAVRTKPGEAVDVVHGTTLGLNAVLQARLPRTVFVTNRGFRDLVEIGRQERADLYALEPDRAEPPVPRALRLEVDCRRGPGGVVERPLTPAAIAAVAQRARRLRPAAIAVGLLHSPAASADERRIAAALRAALPRVPVTCSAELWPGFGEYERFCAAILNAAIAPLVADYTRALHDGLGAGRLRLMRSSTGIVPPREAAQFPARTLFSGPAGGVLATDRLAQAARLPRAAAFDMGGTSTDVCLVQRGSLHTDAATIAGLPLPLPSVDVHTVGCGGGSIAYRDAGGALRVGPQSAGADPGPACYGRGDEPTVTDAHVALGHIGADTLLGGGFPIDVDRGVRAVERLGRKLGLSTLRAARGILDVADVSMTRALMRITGDRAVDPASVPLVAYGGAGGLHAAALVRRLGLKAAIVPAHPGAFSALGLALAGESVELLDAVLEPWSPSAERAWRRRAAALCRSAARLLGPRSRASATLLLRYAGQGGGLALPLGRGPLGDAFRRAHQQRFGFAPGDAGIELVRITARAELPGPAFPRTQGVRGTMPRAQRRRSPAGGPVICVRRREETPDRSRIRGPCVIEEMTAATVVPVGWIAEVGALGISLRPSR
jgi:N-methylhydantoinase A